MRIHHVEIRYSHEHTLDPVNGKVALKRDQYLAAGSTSAISFNNEEYRVQPDGTFEVPDDVAADFLKRNGWFEGPNPFADQIQANKQKAKTEKHEEDVATKAEKATKTTKATTKKVNTAARKD